MTPVSPALTGLPMLETERLMLRGPQTSDWAVFRDYRASARTAFTGGPKAPDEAAQQFAAFFGHWVMRGFGRLIAEERATGLAVGHFGPMRWLDEGPVELTWSLWTAQAEGRGLAHEASRAMCGWMFGALGWASVRAEVHADNAASHALALRLGGAVMDDTPTTWFEGGSVYRITREGVA